MAIVTTLQNNMTGLDFRQTLNNNLANLNLDKVEVVEYVKLDSRVGVLESNVDIVNDAVFNLDSEVEQLQLQVGGILDKLDTLYYSELQDFDVPSNVYTDVINDTIADLPIGIYRLDLSMIYKSDNNNRSSFFRFSIDGGTTWSEFRKQTKQVQDINNETLFKVVDHSGGDLNIIIQSRKENTNDTLTIQYITYLLEQK